MGARMDGNQVFWPINEPDEDVTLAQYRAMVLRVLEVFGNMICTMTRAEDAAGVASVRAVTNEMFSAAETVLSKKKANGEPGTKPHE